MSRRPADGSRRGATTGVHDTESLHSLATRVYQVAVTRPCRLWSGFPWPRLLSRRWASRPNSKFIGPRCSGNRVDRGRDRHERQSGVRADQGAIVGDDQGPERREILETRPGEQEG